MGKSDVLKQCLPNWHISSRRVMEAHEQQEVNKRSHDWETITLKASEGSSPVIWNRLKTCWGGEPCQQSHRDERYRECRVVCKLGRDGRRIEASVSLNQGCGAGVAVLGWAFHHCTCFCVIPVPVSLCKSLTHTPVTVPTKNQVAH